MTDRANEATLTIGQFGRLSQLSRKALRLYEQRGLLMPVRVDPWSGYRYYARPQVHAARRIRLLRAMEMPLDEIARVLAAWEQAPEQAQRLIRAHRARMAQRLEAVHVLERLLLEELDPSKEKTMLFTFVEAEMPTYKVVSIRRHITAPAYHEWIMPALRQLRDHIEACGATQAGDPVALYYGPLNEEDDGPVEICVPITGTAEPRGGIKVRELPAHKAVQVKTHGEYNRYPKVLEVWNALARHVQDGDLEPNWADDMTTYEIWHDDETMTIGWPVKAFA